MVLLENSELLKARNNILDTVFADDMQDLNEIVEQLENNEEIKDKALITRNSGISISQCLVSISYVQLVYWQKHLKNFRIMRT